MVLRDRPVVQFRFYPINNPNKIILVNCETVMQDHLPDTGKVSQATVTWPQSLVFKEPPLQNEIAQSARTELFRRR